MVYNHFANCGSQAIQVGNPGGQSRALLAPPSSYCVTHLCSIDTLPITIFNRVVFYVYAQGIPKSMQLCTMGEPIYIWAVIAGSKAATSKPRLSPSTLQRTFLSVKKTFRPRLTIGYFHIYPSINFSYILFHSPSYTVIGSKENMKFCHANGLLMHAIQF